MGCTTVKEVAGPQLRWWKAAVKKFWCMAERTRWQLYLGERLGPADSTSAAQHRIHLKLASSSRGSYSRQIHYHSIIMAQEPASSGKKTILQRRSSILPAVRQLWGRQAHWRSFPSFNKGSITLQIPYFPNCKLEVLPKNLSHTCLHGTDQMFF